MKLISQATSNSLSGGSWIRKMFEAGIALKKEFGEDQVCDFSLGNPDLAPPQAVAEAIKEFAAEAHKPFALGYMPNGGAPWARQLLAESLSHTHNVSLSGEDVILSCGAAGAMNAFFKATLDPADEVIAIAPYFVEYGSYVSNHGGVLRTVHSTPDTFSLDIQAIEQAITPKTRAIIINSPNNPTGQIYSLEELQELVALLTTYSAKNNRPIFIVADEPYRFLAFDNIEVPSILPLYPYSVVVSSFSKNLCIPGERVGYLAVSPLLDGREQLIAGVILANRILGYVNPPVVGQYILRRAVNAQVDPEIYRKRRDLMASLLTEAGYEFLMPRGAFYFFPKAPGGDDVAFAARLQEERILVVPGRGFGTPGHFRMAFCVGEDIIARAAEGLKKAIR